MVHLHCSNFHVSSISLSRDMDRGQICPQAYVDPKEPKSNRVKATLIYIFSRGTQEFPSGKLPPGQFSPVQFPPRIVAPPPDNWPPVNYPRTVLT